jgi:hypothetical protein
MMRIVVQRASHVAKRPHVCGRRMFSNGQPKPKQFEPVVEAPGGSGFLKYAVGVPIVGGALVFLGIQTGQIEDPHALPFIGTFWDPPPDVSTI